MTCQRPLTRPRAPVCAPGDGRVNEQLVLAITQTMFVREHNRIAYQLAHINPHWDDETIYQVRKPDDRGQSREMGASRDGSHGMLGDGSHGRWKSREMGATGNV